ncbi:MAG: S41 family peptidase [Bacteroidota bacterium]
MKRKKIFLVGLLSVIVLGLSAFYTSDKYFEITRNLDIFVSLFKEVNAFYVDDIDPEKSIRTSIDAMLGTLDPYTVYIPEEDFADYLTMTTGEYGGIGALITEIDGKVVITMPNEGFPAHKAGIKIGDHITNINGTNTIGKSSTEVSKLLKGTSGTDITIKVNRQGEEIEFNLKRAKIIIDNVPYYGIVNDSIGYIKLNEFTTNAAKEVKNALLSLKKDGAKKIILDVRGNPGGILQEAVAICNLFIPKNKSVVETKGKTPNWNKIYRTSNKSIDKNIPLAVLTSSRSASAAEIVAGTLQDYDRGVLVGTKTFGKGLVQTTRPVGYNSKVKITVAKYYTPSGRCIQAIDYAHRNLDGSVGKIPDSLIVAFKTENGRTVYDGGGITPDVKVTAEYFSPIAIELMREGYVFNYATKYYYEHPEAPDMHSFEISDEVYADFSKWINGSELEYDNELEQAIVEFEEKLVETSQFESLKLTLEELKSEVIHNQAEDLIKFQDEIRDVLAAQIVSRYSLAKGEIANSLKNDPDVLKAIEILNSPEEYKALLSSK